MTARSEIQHKIRLLNDQIGELYGQLEALDEKHYGPKFYAPPNGPKLKLKMDPATRQVLATMPDPPRENVTLSRRTNK